MQLQTLHDLFVEQLRDLYSAETQLVQALPEMAGAASDDELRKAFAHHLEETRDHVARLEEVFGQLGVSAAGETCESSAFLSGRRRPIAPRISSSRRRGMRSVTRCSGWRPIPTVKASSTSCSGTSGFAQ